MELPSGRYSWPLRAPAGGRGIQDAHTKTVRSYDGATPLAALEVEPLPRCGSTLEVDEVDPQQTSQGSSRPQGARSMFVILIMTMVAVNYDSGASAAVLPFLQIGCPGHVDENDAPAYDAEFPCLDSYGQGVLGALPYIGLCFGCPVAGSMLQLRNERLVICIALGLNAFFTFVFGFVVKQNDLFLAKFFIGLTQSAICVYLPVWVDCFAAESQRNTWLGLVQGIGGLGAMVGYGISGYLTAGGVFYQWTFRIQGIWICVCIVLIALAPTKLICVSANARAPVPCSLPITSARQVSLAGVGTSIHMVTASPASTPDSQQGFCAQLGPLCSNALFMWTAAGVCCLFFVVTGVQYWATKFYITCFERPASQVTSIFLFVSITAPVAGVLAGGTIVDRITHGAIQPTAWLVRLWGCVAVVAGIAASAMPITPGPSLIYFFYLDVLFLWILLFFGAMMLAPCTGIILQSVQDHEKTTANAFSMVLYNIFGYALGAGLPGQIAGVLGTSGWSERESLHMAMQVIFVVGSVSGFGSTWLMYRAACKWTSHTQAKPDTKLYA